MPRFAANISFLYTEVDFLDRFAAAAEAGFTAVEWHFPYGFDKHDLARHLADNGLTCALINLPAGDWDGGERGIACLPDRVAEFEDGVVRAIDYAEALGCRRINCLAGVTPSGGDDDDLAATFAANLRHAAARMAEAGITLLIEPINTRDMPGFYLNRSAQALSIIDASITWRSWRRIPPPPSRPSSTISAISRSPTPRAATSPAPATSITPPCSIFSTASATPAGWVANTNQRRRPSRDLGG